MRVGVQIGSFGSKLVPYSRHVLDFVFQPDPDRDEPVWRQLERHLREWIAAGRILPGERLPPSRELAGQLGIGRNSVSQAYQALIDDGVARARVGRGTFVAPRPNLRAFRGTTADAAPPERAGFAWDALLSRAERRAWPPPRPATVRPDVPIRFDFRGGRVDAEALPAAELKRAWGRAVGDRLSQLANADDPRGYGPLREEISLSLVSRGIACEPEDVLVVSGAQQGLDLVARTLIDSGDIVAMEEPGYFGAARAFRRAGAELLPIPVDDRGLVTEALARALRGTRAKLVYTTPSAQVPTGVTLDAARREALLDLSDRHHVPIVEDDYDSELRFAGPPLPALKTRDPAGRVIYVGTFSKALFPGLRVGYVVAARALLVHLTATRFFADMGGDIVSQAVVADLLASGALEKHVRRVRRLHAARRAALLEALDRHMPNDVAWTRPSGGRLVWLTLPRDVDPDALAGEAAAAGIAYGRGEMCTVDDVGRRSLILSFVNESTDAIDAGIGELAGLVSGLRRARSSA